MTLIEVDRITDDIDHLDIAETAAEALLSEPSIPPMVAMYARAGLASLAVQRADQSAAAYHYPFLLKHRGTMIWTVSSVDRLLGRLSQAMGNTDEATLHFEHALAFCRNANYRPELAWTCTDYAETLLQRNHSQSLSEAFSLLDEANSIATGLGMRPLMERVAAHLNGLAEGPPPAPAYPDGLTHREVEVLRLITLGRGDREIAEELVLSTRTVNTHVRNILNKTAVANRTEAATYAAHYGLA
jgi:DNA-binding CsgD family transcriptional regulator